MNPEYQFPTTERCFACGRKLGNRPAAMADTRDAQTVFVGSECFRLITTAGDAGYQPPKGGPRLWIMPTPPRSPDPRPVGEQP